MKQCYTKPMRIIAVVESDDYSGAAIIDPSYITITKFDDNFYLAATKCMFSQVPVTCEISKSDAEKMIASGVKCFDLFGSNPNGSKPKRKYTRKKD